MLFYLNNPHITGRFYYRVRQRGNVVYLHNRHITQRFYQGWREDKCCLFSRSIYHATISLGPVGGQNVSLYSQSTYQRGFDVNFYVHSVLFRHLSTMVYFQVRISEKYRINSQRRLPYSRTSSTLIYRPSSAIHKLQPLICRSFLNSNICTVQKPSFNAPNACINKNGKVFKKLWRPPSPLHRLHR